MCNQPLLPRPKIRLFFVKGHKNIVAKTWEFFSSCTLNIDVFAVCICWSRSGVTRVSNQVAGSAYIHVFPEPSRNTKGEDTKRKPVKRGVPARISKASIGRAEGVFADDDDDDDAPRLTSSAAKKRAKKSS